MVFVFEQKRRRSVAVVFVFEQTSSFVSLFNYFFILFVL